MRSAWPDGCQLCGFGRTTTGRTDEAVGAPLSDKIPESSAPAKQ
ncbi:MAG: hypothetical protein SGJ19_06185 [Planctomycetia bacterium]|nr:hypothetical protein [Planctomycetia bacterium]